MNNNEVKFSDVELLAMLSEICSYVQCLPLQTRIGFDAIRINKTNTVAYSAYSSTSAYDLAKAIEKDLSNDVTFEHLPSSMQLQLEESGLTAKVNLDRKEKAKLVSEKVEFLKFWRPDFFLAR